MPNLTVQGNIICIYPLHTAIIGFAYCPDTYHNGTYHILHRWAIGCAWSPSGKRLCFTGQDSSVQVTLSPNSHFTFHTIY